MLASRVLPHFGQSGMRVLVRGFRIVGFGCGFGMCVLDCGFWMWVLPHLASFHFPQFLALGPIKKKDDHSYSKVKVAT